MESSAVPAAGWFPDPGDPSTERWWSGVSWTEHTRLPLSSQVPEAFAARLATLVEERPEEMAEQEPFVFAMKTAEPEPAATTFETPAVPASPFNLTPTVAQVADPDPAGVAPQPASPAPATPTTPETASSMTPEPVFQMPATPEPVLQMPATPEPAAAPRAPEYTAPASGFTLPSTPAAPTLPVESVAAAGFVLPAAPVAALTAEDLAPRPGKHADAVPEPSAPAPALPAVRPVGFTSSADPEVANRYRTMIHQADVETPEASAPVPPTAAAPAPVSMLASSTMTTGRPPFAPTYAVAPATNKAADLAFRMGLGATIGVVVGFVLRVVGVIDLAGGVISLGAWVSGVVAIVAGIVGLVAARRRQVGFGKALTGLLLGVLVSVLVPLGVVLLAVLLLGSLGFFA